MSNVDSIDSEVRESGRRVTFADNTVDIDKTESAEEAEEENEADAEENEADAEIKEEEVVPVNEEPLEEGVTQTRFGRVVRPPERYGDLAVMALTKAELGYQANLRNMAMLEFAAEDCSVDYEIAGVGAGLGGSFQNTHELKPMKYDEAMAVDKAGWTKAVEEEH